MNICKECEYVVTTDDFVAGRCEMCDAPTFGSGAPDKLCAECAKAVCACQRCGRSLKRKRTK